MGVFVRSVDLSGCTLLDRSPRRTGFEAYSCRGSVAPVLASGRRDAREEARELGSAVLSNARLLSSLPLGRSKLGRPSDACLSVSTGDGAELAREGDPGV